MVIIYAYTRLVANSTEKLLYQTFTHKYPDEILIELGSSSGGLSDSTVNALRSQHELNLLSTSETGKLDLLIRQFRSPFIYILLFAALLAFALGEYIDSSIILIFVAINATLGFYQEFRSDQAIKMLKRYTAPAAHVIRDGAEEEIPTYELLPGDIVLLEPGDIVPADMRLLETTNFSVNESALTGEAIASEKTHQSINKIDVPIHEAKNIAFSGTSVVSGKAKGVVFAIGQNAYIGKIAKLTAETVRVSSFGRGMASLSNFVLKMVGVTLFLVFFANLLIKGGGADTGDMILFIIALAASVIPEALPLVITFSLSRGAIRLSKHKVVVKRLSAIEGLGGVKILCTDKTGTITENTLNISEAYGDYDIVLNQAFAAISRHSSKLDPFDTAIEKARRKSKQKTKDLPIHEIPFDPTRKRNSVLVPKGSSFMLIVRGAEEAILPYISKKDANIAKWIKSQEEQGKRVIVVAHKILTDGSGYEQKQEEKDLILTGALSFTDPPKKSAIKAVKTAQKLGVSIKIITGDGDVVAGTIARQIGLVESAKEVITAQEFFTLNSKKQQQIAEKMRVFARFSPSQKHQLIEILQQNREVGFLGDGVNDAPALKAANVAIAVQGASDIAREAADIILLNSSLNIIVNGIREGRQVFTNTIKYVKMTLASNFGNFYAIAAVTLFIEFLPMLPVQILLVNLLTDFPLISVATDSVDPKDIAKPEGYNTREFALFAIIFGVVSSAFDFLFFGTFYKISPQALQTNWFIGCILTELLLLYSLRSKQVFYKAPVPSKIIVILTLIAASATIIIPYTQIGQSAFHFVAPSAHQIALVLGITVTYFVVNELVKVTYYSMQATKT